MSLKDIIGRGPKRTFSPVRAEGRLARVTGMDMKSRHTPTSQLFEHFEKPTHGFSLKQVLSTSPMDRQKFAREMVSYRQQVAEQRKLEAEQKKLAEQLGDAYRETASYQARQIKSIEDLGKEKQRLQDIYQDTKKAYQDLQSEVSKQKVAQAPVRTTTAPRTTTAYRPTADPMTPHITTFGRDGLVTVIPAMERYQDAKKPLSRPRGTRLQFVDGKLALR